MFKIKNELFCKNETWNFIIKAPCVIIKLPLRSLFACNKIRFSRLEALCAFVVLMFRLLEAYFIHSLAASVIDSFRSR